MRSYLKWSFLAFTLAFSIAGDAYAEVPKGNPQERRASTVGISRNNSERCWSNPVLFEHREFNSNNPNGAIFEANESIRDLSTRRFNNQAGSICVAPGWQVVAYARSGNRTIVGERLLYNFDNTSGNSPRYWNFPSGSDMNDAISAILVQYFYEVR